VALLLVAELTVAAPAWCQETAPKQEPAPKAEQLFLEGLNLARVGDCVRAREKFTESYATDPAPGTLVNWALCEEKLGRLGTALDLLRRADQGMPADHPKRALVAKHIEVLAGRAPFLRMHVAQALPVGTAVLKDGVVVDPASLEKSNAIDPGPHIVEVRAPGHQDRRYNVLLTEGRTLDLTLEPGSALSSLPPAGPTAERTPSDDRLLGWIIAGGGLAALGVGTVTGLLVKERWDTVKSHCNPDTKLCYDDAGIAANESGPTLATVSTVAFIAGGLGLAIGGYLVFAHPGRPATSTQLSPMAGPGTIGLRVRGGF
jgi:hypothetical protein